MSYTIEEADPVPTPPAALTSGGGAYLRGRRHAIQGLGLAISDVIGLSAWAKGFGTTTDRRYRGIMGLLASNPRPDEDPSYPAGEGAFAEGVADELRTIALELRPELHHWAARAIAGKLAQGYPQVRAGPMVGELCDAFRVGVAPITEDIIAFLLSEDGLHAVRRSATFAEARDILAGEGHECTVDGVSLDGVDSDPAQIAFLDELVCDVPARSGDGDEP